MVAEGVKTAKAVYQFAANRGMDLPIVQAVYELLYQGVTVERAIDNLMARQVGREFPPQLLLSTATGV